MSGLLTCTCTYLKVDKHKVRHDLFKLPPYPHNLSRQMDRLIAKKKTGHILREVDRNKIETCVDT